VSILEDFRPLEQHPAAGANPWEHALLRRQLAAFRTDAGLSQQNLADEAGWSFAKVSRIENGHTTPNVADTLAIAAICGVQDRDTQHEVTARAKQIKQAKRPAKYRNHPFGSYLDYEAAAARISIYATGLAPDFMQSDAHAELIRRGLGEQSSPEAVAQENAFRRLRAAYLLGNYAPEVRIILDQTIMHRINDRRVFDGFMQDCHSLASADNSGAISTRATLQVEPYTKGFPSSRWSYVILESPNAADAPMVFTSALDQYHEIKKPAQQYLAQFDQVAAALPSPSDTPQVLADIRRQHDLYTAAARA
jgi:transcriptional regulator with XRE-family HTH domain